MNAKIINNLKQYRGESLLKKAAMNVLVKHLGPKQIESLSDVQVQIPKFGKAESLNVSISVGIVANEIKRLSFKG